MENKLVIGIDAGNAEVKTSDCVKYVSGIRKAGDLMVGEGLHFLHHDNEDFVIGYERDSENLNHFSDRNMYRKSLPGIARAIEKAAANGEIDPDQHVNIELVAGGPLTHVNDQFKLEMYDYYAGQCNFGCDGFNYDCSIEVVKTAKQGFAPFLRNYNTLKQYKNVYIVDIGGGTNDAFMVKNGRPILESFVSAPTGSNHLITNIRNRFEMLNRKNLSDDEIRDIISGKDSGIKVTEKMQWAVQEEVGKWFTTSIFEQKRFVDAGYDFFNGENKVCWMSGGAQLLHDHILDMKEIDTVLILNEFANAQSYKALAPRLK